VDADDLYGLPLDRFVPERTALARAVRADGRREEAAAVMALRKPSVAAWAVNQLVRTQSRVLSELFEAGDALREAQDAVLAGPGDASGLRAAAGREREAADQLVSAARGLLTSDGHQLNAAIIDRVADTLHAAALDEAARGTVREGRLERELRHAGLGLGAGASTAPPKRASPTERKSNVRHGAPSGRQPPAAGEQRERAAARRIERERADARRAARATESEARRLADRAARARKVAEERRERAAQALGQADAALETARAEAETAAAALRRAQAKLMRA
jgi:hypothetical protein